MKRNFLILTLAFALFACNEERNQAETVEINVPTLQCDKCIAHVEAALKSVAGVSTTAVNLQTKIARVGFDPAKTNLAALEQAITQAGYDANTTSRSLDAYAALESCCKLPE